MSGPPYYIDPPFANGMDSSDQPSPGAGPSNATQRTTPALHPLHLKSFRLFGNEGQHLVVQARKEAMDTLSDDMADGSMYIFPQDFGSATTAVIQGWRRLQGLNQFPSDQQLQAIGQQSKANPSPSFPFITPTGFDDLGTERNPHFLTLNVNVVFQTLRQIALKSYEGYEVFAPAFQLGVVTHTVNDKGESFFHASLFSSDHSEFGNYTIWIFRSCDKDNEGRHVEAWKAFGSGPGTQTRQTVFPPTPEQTPAPNGQRDWTRASKQERQARILTGDLAHLTNDEILDSSCEVIGSNGAEIISGPVLLRLTRFFGNTYIFDRLNNVLGRENRPLIKEANVITRRLTLAIEKETRNPGSTKTKQDLRDEINAERRLNRQRA